MMNRVTTFLILSCFALVQLGSANVTRWDDTQSTAHPNARETVEAYVAAALAGEVTDAAAFGTAGTAAESKQQIEDFNRILDGDSPVVISRVLVSEEDNVALAVSDQVKLVEPNPDRQDTGCLVFSLSRSDGKWSIGDIDFESEADAEKEIATFKEKHADAKEIVSGRQSGATEPIGDGKSTNELKIFYLVHADAQSMAAVLSQLFHDVAVATDPRSNTIIATGSHGNLAMCEALLLRLDTPQPERPSDESDDRRDDATRQPRQPSAAPQRASLRENYEQLEQRAARLAEQYAALPTKATRTPGDAEALKQQLADVVKQAFAARQQLQQAELAQLRQRLARIEQQIAARERIKDAIIDRRTEELLNPGLRWDGNRETTHRSSASANVTQIQAVHAVTQTGDYTPADSKAIGQILFGAPLGARVTLRPDRADATTIELPARVNIFKSSSDEPMPFRLSNIPAHAGLELSGTIELTPISAHIRAFLQGFVLPIEFHEQDVDNASSGNLVTQVVYLPKSEHQEFALAGMETITSTRLNAGFNPSEYAERRGYVFATMRLGNRVPDDPSSAIEASRGPVTSPSTAVVWIETVAEEPQADGGRQPKAVYRNGTTVSPDGLIAVALKQRMDPTELWKTATVYLDDLRIVEGRLVAYDAEFGAGLIKADVIDVPYLALATAPIAADQQLSLYKMTMSSRRQKDRWTAEVRVGQTNCRINGTEGFFTIARTRNIDFISQRVAGAALVSVSDQLVGILGLNPQSQDEGSAEAAGNPEAAISGYCAIPAHVINRLMEKYRAESSKAQPHLEPVEERARTDGKDIENPEKTIWDTLGVKLRPLSHDELPNDRYRGGMQVTEIRKGGPAAEAKMRDDDVIVGIGRWETISVENVVFVLNHPDVQPKHNQSSDVKIFVLRGDETLLTTILLVDPSKAAN